MTILCDVCSSALRQLNVQPFGFGGGLINVASDESSSASTTGGIFALVIIMGLSIFLLAFVLIFGSTFFTRNWLCVCFEKCSVWNKRKLKNVSE